MENDTLSLCRVWLRTWYLEWKFRKLYFFLFWSLGNICKYKVVEAPW